MGFLVQLAIWAFFTIAAELLRPKPNFERLKPPTLGDLSFPTTTEARVIPLIWGKIRMRAPNVLWYGDLETRPIEERVRTGLFSKETIVKGYEIYVGVQLGLCRGEVDEVTKIWIEEDELWSGTVTVDASAISVDEPTFFGGEDGASANGGFSGDIRVHLGSNTQATSSYLASFQSPLPAYRNIFYVVLEKVYYGNSVNIPAMSIEAGRYPNALGLTGGNERIGDDCNAVCVIYEIMSDQRWGLNQGSSKFDLTLWQSVGDTIFNEGIGMAGMLDSPRDALEILQLVVDSIDAVIYTDLSDELIKIRLIRRDYVVANLPVLDQSNLVDVQGFTRVDWRETVNQVTVQYADRAESYADRSATEKDPGNRRIQGKTEAVTKTSFGAKTADAAQVEAARDIRQMSLPVAKGSCLASRQIDELTPGEPFVLDWPPLGITGLVARVLNIRPGTPEDQRYKIDFAEDTFGLGDPAYAAPQATGWVAPSQTPVAVLKQRLFEVPLQLTVDAERHVGVLAARNGGLHQGYTVWADYSGGTTFVEARTNLGFTPVGELTAALGTDHGDLTPYEATVSVDTLVDVTLSDLQDAASSTVSLDDPRNIILVGDELMYFTAAADGGSGVVDLTVQRGCFDTIPEAASEDDDVWFLGFNSGLVSEIELTSGTATINVKVLPYTDTAKLDIDDATAIAITLANRLERPIPPGDPQLNGELFVDDDWTNLSNPVTLTWETRNRETQALDTKQDDPDVTPAVGVTYEWEARQASDDAVVDSGSTSGSSASISNLVSSTDYYVTLQADLSGVKSPQWVSRDFTMN